MPIPRRTPLAAGRSIQGLIERHCMDILASEGIAIERRCMQHGTTSVFRHSVAVTHACVSLACRLRVPVHERDLLRGALLHDYFLYDWHESDPAHRLHGFRHPRTAYENARRDFALTAIEGNMILRHMFPLTPVPPTCREAWLLCMADKYVVTRETARGLVRRLRGRGDARRAGRQPSDAA